MKHVLGDLLDLRDSGRTADQQHLGDLRGLELGVLNRLEARRFEPLEDRLGQRLELAAGDRHLQVLGPGGVGGDKRQIDRRFDLRAQFALGLFRRFLEPLMGHRVLAEVDAFFLAELLGQILHQHLVEIVAAQVRIAVGAEHLEDIVADVENRNIECPAAEVEDGDLPSFFFSRP